MRILLLIFSAAAILLPATVWAAAADIDPVSYPGPAWSPYLIGSLIGVLSWLTFYFSNKALGASSQYGTLAGLAGKAVAPKHTKSLHYFKENPPQFKSWGMMLAIGMIGGAFLAAWTGGELTNRWLPPMWEDRFGGDSQLLRGITAFSGGLLMAFGARLAGGCTSGHGISGTLQLSVGSWIAAMGFFLGGIATAFLLYRI